MDQSQLERVKLLVRPDGWLAFEAAQPDETERGKLLDALFAEYSDARLVAAYALELACAYLREQAVGANHAAKKIKVGPIEIERAVSATPQATQADTLCNRAAGLRREANANSGFSLQFSSPLHVRGRR